MTPGLAWASLLLRAARRDGLRNAWLWIGPLLVAQQISDLDERSWLLYIIPLFGLIFGNSLNGRGVTPSGARMGESPALLVPVSARARVVGALVAGTVVSGVVSLTAFVTAQVGRELIDLAWGGPNTYTPDPVRALRGAATCVLALLPTVALPASAPPWRSVPWHEGIVLGLVGAGVYFDAPAIIGDLSTLVAWCSVLCVALVGTAPFLERTALRHAGSSRYAQRAARSDRSVSVLGAPPRTPARALLQMHASTGLVVTSGVTLALTGVGALAFFLSGDPRTLPFLLPMVATLGAALLPTLPLATGQTGALRFDMSPAMWLPVRPRTLWWTSLVAVCAQLGIALTMASVGTAALGLVVPSVSVADTVTRILAGSPLCAAAVLLLRAGLHLGPLMPAWARVGCLSVGAIVGLAAPVEIGLPRELLGEQRLAFSVTFLLATMAALVALTPRRVRGA